jgi:hypothetical protein
LKKKTPETSHTKSDASISPVESPLNETKKKLIFGSNNTSNSSVHSGGATVALIQKKIFEPIPEFASPESDSTSPAVPYLFNSPIMKTPNQRKEVPDLNLSLDQVSPFPELKDVEKNLKSPMSPIYRKALTQSTRKWSMVENLDFEEPNSKSRRLENEKVHPDVNLVSETIYSNSNGSSPASDFALSSFGFDDEEEDERIEDHPDVLKFLK